MGLFRKDDNELPADEHLLDDISVPHEDLGQERDHLADDINRPDAEQVTGAEFDERHYTAGQLNAGQQVAGLSPDGEYARNREEELEN